MPAQIPAAARTVASTPEAVADLLLRTRTQRGLSLTVDDPAVIAKVAAIVAAGGER